MSEAKHTPGPWEATFIDIDGVRTPVVVSSVAAPGSNGICSLWMSGHLTGNFKWNGANHSLIAAAPDLLAACESLLPLLADAIVHGMPVTQAVADARNHAVAALAKAKGGAA